MNVCGVLPERDIEKIHDRLVAGIRDYMVQNNFKKIVLGLSGGVDSAVTCALAVKAAGKDNVLGISMPSKYSSEESVSLAKELAGNLGIDIRVVPINAIYDSYLSELETHMGKNERQGVEIYHQNIQARIRGNILMAFSNRYGYLVVATGNRSEAMMGYCTLYGDTVGGLAVISDIYKTEVYRLADHINREGELIPRETITKAPSAELKPGQKDEDSLPPYDMLDRILHGLLDKGLDQNELKDQGFDSHVVDTVAGAIASSEYKRNQCPRGIKIEE